MTDLQRRTATGQTSRLREAQATDNCGLQSHDNASQALAAISADLPRDEWVRVGMAAKSAGLSFDEFDNWSQGGTSYKAADCRDVWKSLKGNGGIGAGTLFHTAKQHGWKASASPVAAITAAPAPIPTGEAAKVIWERCEPLDAFAPYPIQKAMEGEPLQGLRQLPDGDKLRIAGNAMAGALVVPAYAADGSLQSLQLIPNGSPKMNLPGHAMKGARFIVGEVKNRVFLCEGIGQAFACWQSTGDAAVACFGWGNVQNVVSQFAGNECVIVPDVGKEASAEKVASDAGALLATLPEGEENNFDVCDLMQRDGRQALADLLNNAWAPVPQENDEPPHPLTVTVPLDFQPHPPRWVIPGLIAEGVVIVAGMRAVGKTTALLPLALTAAGLHEPEYPLAPKHWRHVVYVTEDCGQAQRILSGLSADLHLDRATVAERFHLVEAKRLPPDALVTAGDTLRQRYTRTVEGVDVLPLIVLDTQAATVELESENDNAEASRAIAALKQRFAGLPVWLVAHVAKGAAPKRGADEVTARGAGAFESDVNQVLYAVMDGDKRYLLTGKTRFEPRWRELILDSFTDDVTATDEFGDTQHITLRWSIARPLESGERTKASKEAADKSRLEDEAELRQSVRDAVQVEWQGGRPLSRNAVSAKIQRNKATTNATVERLLSECWLWEVEVPKPQRVNNRKSHFLVNLDTSEHEAVLRGEAVPATKLVIPQAGASRNERERTNQKSEISTSQFRSFRVRSFPKENIVGTNGNGAKMPPSPCSDSVRSGTLGTNENERERTKGYQPLSGTNPRLGRAGVPVA